jgi:hypothetical protein
LSWSHEFDEPIGLANGKSLRTLREAANSSIGKPQLRALSPRPYLQPEHPGDFPEILQESLT